MVSYTQNTYYYPTLYYSKIVSKFPIFGIVSYLYLFSIALTTPLNLGGCVTDYQHCAETRDCRLEGSKTALTLPYILLADRYYLQITVPISVTYYPIMSYYLHRFIYIYYLISIDL